MATGFKGSTFTRQGGSDNVELHCGTCIIHDIGNRGRLLHQRDAAGQKARSPMVRSLVLGTRRSELLVDLRLWVEVCGWRFVE
ncbi:hypothetical protein EYF80_014824 [Liparis tanakae]|uniref:Uncharacterized protein n=1 Tax=Liparis tanakae TaxID=230148 RepID=A0A4Z2IA46_9TELE|nr:hypothetical protein EYF80_014824 [Liparis tanakae]